MADEQSRPTTRRDQPKPGRPLLDALLNKLVNPCTRWVLRSPFHRVMSRTVMLVSIKGRRTGRIYTTPVNYVREGDVVTAVSNRNRTWWRNIGDGAAVSMRIRGASVSGEAHVLTLDDAALALRLQDFYAHISPVRPSSQKALELAPKKVVIQITCGRAGSE